MKGDFLGFSFDGIHCSKLGITHVSGGDRYDENLFPEVRDKSVEIPNSHGEYFYGSTYGTRTFDLAFAYDNVSEEQFRKIRRLFGQTKICELIFDERPYKVYYAKVESPIEMNYVCFEEDDYIYDSTNHIGYIPGSINHRVYNGRKKRVYKGEGTISFICHFPFARQLFKIKELYYDPTSNIINDAIIGNAEVDSEQLQGNLVTTYPNVDEWIDSSGILSQEIYNLYKIDREVKQTPVVFYNSIFPVYNPGDLNVGFCLYIPFNNGKISPRDSDNYIIINGYDNTLFLSEISKKGSDTGILINTVNHLIEGVIYSPTGQLHDERRPAWQTTGNIYNEYIKKGDFPHIKRNDWRLDNVHNNPELIGVRCADTNGDMSIYYNYLYF